MKLNCKVGDIAIRIKDHELCKIPIGHIVEIYAWRGKSYRRYDNRLVEDAWLVMYKGSKFSDTGHTWAISDSELRPLRPDEGQDETLSWKDVPTEIKVNEYETTET